MVSNSISMATTTAKPRYMDFYGAAESNEQEEEPVNYSIKKQQNEFSSSSNNKRLNINHPTNKGIDEITRNRVRVKSNILLIDPVNRHNTSHFIDTGDSSGSINNHFSGSNRSPVAINVNSQSRNHSFPITAATPLKVSTAFQRARPSATNLQVLHGLESKSPLNVSLKRSTSEPIKESKAPLNISLLRSISEPIKESNTSPNVNLMRSTYEPIKEYRSPLNISRVRSISEPIKESDSPLNISLVRSFSAPVKESKSPLNVSLVRSTSDPVRTSDVNSIISKKQCNNMDSSNIGMEISSFSGLKNDFTRPNNILVSNANVMAMNSAENIMSKSSKSSELMGNGLTMSGLSIQRISSSAPTSSVTYQSNQGYRDVNKSNNILEVSRTNINNIGVKTVNGVQFVEINNVESNDTNNGSMERETINNLNNKVYINNRESIEKEERSNILCSSSSTSKSLLWGSSSGHHKRNPVISIIPVGKNVNMTANGNTVPYKGNEINMLDCSIGSEEHWPEQDMNPLQLTTNSVTITELQPDTKNTILYPHQPTLLYRASSYEEGDIGQPVMIVGPMDSVSSEFDSALFTGEQKPSFGNPVTITPISNNIADRASTIQEEPHPLSLFSAVAANQEYLPTSAMTTSSTLYTNASPQGMSANLQDIQTSNLSEHLNSSEFGLFISTASNDGSLFSEYMEHSDTLSLSPPPAGMQRRPKVSYKNLTEGEKNHRLRMLNNEASRLYRHRKQRTLKNLEVEEQQLQVINAKLRVEFESLQLERDKAMKMLHESLQNCRDCNTRQNVQSGPCSHRNTNTPLKRLTVDSRTQLNWSSKINSGEHFVKLKAKKL